MKGGAVNDERSPLNDAMFCIHLDPIPDNSLLDNVVQTYLDESQKLLSHGLWYHFIRLLVVPFLGNGGHVEL